MSLHDDLLEYDGKYRQRMAAIEAASAEVRDVFQKYFPGQVDTLAAPKVLAACVELFDIGDKKNAGQLYLEWLVEHYVGRKVAANLEDVKTVVEALEKGGFTEANPYDFNDTDNGLFYIPHGAKLIFCAESQSRRYVFILAGNKFLIRRYYDDYDFDGEKDKWQRKEEDAYTKKGIREAIVQSDWLSDRWSDCVPGNTYPQRPNLQYFKDCDFNPRYGDCRDTGHVLSYDGFLDSRADRAIYFYPEMKAAFFLLCNAVEEVANF